MNPTVRALARLALFAALAAASACATASRLGGREESFRAHAARMLVCQPDELAIEESEAGARAAGCGLRADFAWNPYMGAWVMGSISPIKPVTLSESVLASH